MAGGFNLNDPLNRRHKQKNLKGPNRDEKRARWGDGYRVSVTVDSSMSGKHNAHGDFAFGAVYKRNGVPWFFIDGNPERADVMALVLARMAWHMCNQLEPQAPGFTEACFQTMADFAEAAAKGENPFVD